MKDCNDCYYVHDNKRATPLCASAQLGASQERVSLCISPWEGVHSSKTCLGFGLIKNQFGWFVAWPWICKAFFLCILYCWIGFKKSSLEIRDVISKPIFMENRICQYFDYSLSTFWTTYRLLSRYKLYAILHFLQTYASLRILFDFYADYNLLKIATFWPYSCIFNSQIPNTFWVIVGKAAFSNGL